MAKKQTYKGAGVDIDAGDEFVEGLKKINPSIGGFGGLIAIPRGYKNPRIVLSTDGVGTKLLVARELNELNTIGIPPGITRLPSTPLASARSRMVGSSSADRKA